MTEHHTTWLIWDTEHNAWWRPAGAGYTTWIAEAGLYETSEAFAIARNAGDGWTSYGVPRCIPVDFDAVEMIDPDSARQIRGLG